MTLHENLADWSDWDVAAHAYGLAIGVFEGATPRQVKHVVLTDNALGKGLHAGVLALVDAGVLERRDDPEEQFRWVFPGGDTLPGAPDSWPAVATAPEPTGLAAPPGSPSEHRSWWKRGRR